MIPVPTIDMASYAFPVKAALGASLPAYDTIPDEFKRHGSKWSRLFQDIWASAITDHKTVGLLPQEGVKAGDAWRALLTLMRVYDIKHEHKEAAFAYLASLWFSDGCWETKDGRVPFDDAEFDAVWRTRAVEERMIQPSVHIGSKGCGDRYMKPGEPLAESRAAQCKCAAGTCWVDYARAEHKEGRPAMTMADWKAAGAPMPPPPPVQLGKKPGRKKK